MTEKRKVLGRGLESLLPVRKSPDVTLDPVAKPAPGESVLEIPLDQLDSNPYQTRTKLDEHALAELVESINALGVVQPIVVRPSANGRYQVIAGERRRKASQMAGRDKIPAIVRQVSNEQAMEMTIVENLQREDLNVMDQAQAYHRLSHEFSLTQDEMAQRTGKDRSTVANFLRLLKLPPMVQELLQQDKLSFGHAKALMTLPAHSPGPTEELAQRIVTLSLSVRQAEEAVTKLMHPRRKAKKQRIVDPNIKDCEEGLKAALGCHVTITDHNGRGRIMVEYTSLEDFDRIFDVIMRTEPE